jgi:hypothetical protein
MAEAGMALGEPLPRQKKKKKPFPFPHKAKKEKEKVNKCSWVKKKCKTANGMIIARVK